MKLPILRSLKAVTIIYTQIYILAYVWPESHSGRFLAECNYKVEGNVVQNEFADGLYNTFHNPDVSPFFFEAL